MKSKTIVYNLRTLHDFKDYGIEIPLLNLRIIETVKILKKKFPVEESHFEPASLGDLSLAHDAVFVEKVKNNSLSVVYDTYELQNLDGTFNRFNPSNVKKPLVDFIEKAKLHVAGTYLAAVYALDLGFSYHLGGGMHHSMSFKPGGFCMFNDLVITARKIQKNYFLRKICIIDLDCHKGDGTAEITKDDDTIQTYSIHMKSGWPLDSPEIDKNGALNPSFIESNMDVEISDSSTYLERLKKSLVEFLSEDYDLCLVVHGVDVFKGDVLESSKLIQLSAQEVLERDIFVHNTIKSIGLPQAWCLGGGYGPEIHKLFIQFLDKIL